MRNLFRHESGFTVLDAVITLCLAGILIGVVIPLYQRVAHEAQEAALKAELGNIRTSLVLFKILNGRHPGSLSELIEKKVMLPGRTGSDPYSTSFYDRNYLIPHSLDARGNILDAFGNVFIYDQVKGEVRSSTQGYDAW